MIQSAKTSPAAETTKVVAPKAAKVAEKGEKKNLLSELENDLEGQDFANELEASMAEEVEVEVKPVQIAADQLLQQPSTLINGLPESNPETVTPKVFDPALTKGVESLIDPSANVELAVGATAVALTDEQVLELAKGETKGEALQNLLKTPQVNQSGRAPAIELTKSEIDPQLMNMEDYVLQKNIANKKAMQTTGYGMKPEALKVAQENGLKQSEVVAEIGKTDGGSKSVNSQQFILDMMKEQSQPKATDAQHTQKVFNMSDVKSDNSTQIMNQISDYIVQAKASKEPTVTMRMNHDQLGMIDITVTKGLNQEAMAVNIGAHSTEGQNFFNQNSKDLFSHLNQAGLKISDIKVETPAETAKNDFDMNQQNHKNGSDKNFGSEQGQRRHENERRKELWNLLNKEAA